MARNRRAGTVSHQPAVRGPLRGRRGLRDVGRAGKRLRGMEVAAALFGNRGAAALRRGTGGAGATDRGSAGPGHAAGHPARLRDLRAAGRQAGEEAAALPAVPRGAGGSGAAAHRPQAQRAGRRGLAHARLRQVADHALAGHQAAARTAFAQPADRGGDRPHAAGPADQRNLRALWFSGAGTGGQYARSAPVADQRRRSHGDDDDSEIRGRAGDAVGSTGRAERLGTRGGHGGRGAPHAVRQAGRAHVEGAAERGADRVHRHAHRQGIQPQHDAALRSADRFLHDPRVGGRPRHGADLLRGAAAGTARRGSADAGRAVRGDVSATCRRRTRRGSSGGTRTRRPWPRRSGGSR